MLTFAKSSTTAVMLTNARKAAGAQLLQIDYSLRSIDHSVHYSRFVS
jgi:hypothetical protein